MAKKINVEKGAAPPIKFVAQEGELSLVKHGPAGPGLARPNCHVRACAHFWGVVEGEPQGPYLTCEAFPKGIPDEIAYGTDGHWKPVDGDNGITFEAKP